MHLKTFVNLETAEIAAIVKKNGPRVIVCPVNGTRRWFALENHSVESLSAFLDRILGEYLRLFECFFSHGITTLLTPILGPDIAGRGEGYLAMVRQAMQEICAGDRFRAYYLDRDVRVRFYGDYEDFFATSAPEALVQIRQVQAATRCNLQHRLFWGMFGHDPLEQIARSAVAYHQENQRHPSRSEIVAAYYGEYVPPADMFIGMLPPVAFDFPLLDQGATALYFTSAPTPYLDQAMFRRILYDYLFVRQAPEAHAELTDRDWEELRSFYAVHRQNMVGLGRRAGNGQFWVPADPNP